MSWLLPVSAFVIALLLLLAALRMMGKFQWLLAFLRGSAGIFLLVVALFVAAFGMDLVSYREAGLDESVATLSFQKTGDQQFRAILVNAEGDEQKFVIQGDQWQLDANILKWSSAIPAKPLYRLDRISGRYLIIEQEQREPKSAFEISKATGQVDAWATVRYYSYLFPFVDALYGSATYLPMADGAIYSISLAQHGLIGRPVNEAAQVAVRGWL